MQETDISYEIIERHFRERPKNVWMEPIKRKKTTIQVRAEGREQEKLSPEPGKEWTIKLRWCTGQQKGIGDPYEIKRVPLIGIVQALRYAYGEPGTRVH